MGSDSSTLPSATLIVRGHSSHRDPLFVLPSAARSMSVPERNVLVQFPFLKSDELRESETLAQAVFANAPKALFVYPKYDLTASLANLDRADTRRHR